MANRSENKGFLHRAHVGDVIRKTYHHYHVWACNRPVDTYMYMNTIGEEGILEVIGCDLSSVVCGLHSNLPVPSYAVLQQIGQL